MNRTTLERRQVWVYLAAIGVGLLVGSITPASSPAFEAFLWPALVVLLYATFLQIPLVHVRQALRDHRFTTVVVVGNFVVMPLVVWGLSLLLPDPAVRLGVLLVLLVPCTDWFITFTQVGGGDTPRALAVTPLNLGLQLLLLPAYLWLMDGGAAGASLRLGDIWPALLVILVPLGLAALTEVWMGSSPGRTRLRDGAAWTPVPLLGLVVFLIATAQAGTVRDSWEVLPVVVPVFVAFLLISTVVARLLGRIAGLPVTQVRTVAFSLGTRNSFVVLPLALALPEPWALAAVVIVVQSLVELTAMSVYVRWLPRW